MVVATLQAPFLFFDSNSLGRILNRFSKDIGQLDEQLPRTFQLAIDSTSSPVFSHISETLDGLETIRTRGRQSDFVDQFYRWVRLVLILSDLHLDLVQWIFRNELLNL